MTFSLPLDQIDAARLDSLKAEGVREGRQLDFEETLPGGTDDDKREFLADVTSFANDAGGDLIFGVRERREDGKPTGEIEAVIGLPSLNVDAEKLRLEAIVRESVEPRISPVTFHEIRRDSEPPCLLVRVPRSWAGLHMVTFKNLSRFYSRTSSGKYQLDVHEIRAGFVAADTAVERLRRVRTERITKILSFDTPALTALGPKLILHALPVTPSDDIWPRVLAIREEDLFRMLPLVGATANTWRFNLDGFVLHTIDSDPSRQCYVQLFRDGGTEAVSGSLLVRDDRRRGFYPSGMEERVIAAVGVYQRFWQAVSLPTPLVVGLTLSGVKGWTVLRGPYERSDLENVLERDVVSPPEVVLADLATPPDVLLRPAFDYVWNGGGWRGSPNYRGGRWFPPT